MAEELTRNAGTNDAFTLVLNAQAVPGSQWTEGQNAILSDAGFAVASETIRGWPGYAETPLVALPALAAETGVAALHYKDESTRFGLGSFKALGGAYAVARLLQKELSARLGRDVSMEEITARAVPEAAQITVCCATDGNHGRSVAWGAQSFGCACVIFIHATVSEGRKTAIEAFGAEVRRTPGNYDDSVREAQEVASAEGWFVVSDTSYPGYMDVPRDVMQGYEIMAAEALDALDQPPTHIFLQTGVGGMAAAVTAQAVRRYGTDRPKIVLCDPDQAACFLASYRTGARTAVHGDLDTLMAGLACGEVSALAWEILQDHGDAVMALTDATAIAAMRRLAFPQGGDRALVAGESAVAGIAGLRLAMADPEAREKLGLDASSRILTFGTEGDTDPELYEELIGAPASQIRA
ncbi:diaminopropionate ammonia-lyase [Alloyangia pacifica]|uniref:Diaminopropionate ammonia-lyase n=1 Tax=Alloyangia pacifica TaxID=311180 RepID=A0A1I6VCI1_9RHOB|nr:diaminopropionate ammonia-lyase [Alloyangia pacifica]SDH83679.1 diaminopropionate ammonia-lyase [Alloyangia pacifica]SFT11352.1 diaminopropionate ammonia-lyase [Alloyangia pacifica]